MIYTEVDIYRGVFRSGGPKSLDMLYDTSEIKNDFITLKDVKAAKAYIELEEGLGHAGLASVIRLTGKK